MVRWSPQCLSMSNCSRREFHVSVGGILKALTHEHRYRFRADRFGSSWYHSHYSAQYAGGLLGPMLIHGPVHAKYDIDLGPVFISDCKSFNVRRWKMLMDPGYHRDYFEVLKDVVGNDSSK